MQVDTTYSILPMRARWDSDYPDSLWSHSVLWDTIMAVGRYVDVGTLFVDACSTPSPMSPGFGGLKVWGPGASEIVSW